MFVENIVISKKIGIGPKTLEVLKNNGIRTVFELANILPTRYLNFKETSLFEENVFVRGNLTTNAKICRIKRNLDYETFEMDTNGKIVKVMIFNRGFLLSKLKEGNTIYVEGKYEEYKNQITATNIYFNITVDTINPIYQFSNIPSKTLNKIINSSLELYGEYFSEYLPKYLLDKYDIPNILDCYKLLHNPSSMDDVSYAMKRLKYEELFKFELKLQYIRSKNREENKTPKKWDIEKIRDFISTIPFELTEGQKKVTNEIFKDLKSSFPANRLIQGDVGSGKTIVACLAMYAVALDGYETCLMAPTEILAYQHYENITNLFKETNLKVVLLTSSTKGKKREELLKKIKNREVDVIIGTHALFTPDIEYNNLGLVVTDEQHRFGVMQRQALRQKGANPDVIYLSATPIPRTLAITLFGDMDSSIIDTLPSNRKKIKTKVVVENKIDIAIDFLKTELNKGNQAYVIAPLIEESEKLNLHDVNSIYEKINIMLPEYKMEILHGKMKQQEKDEIMKRFNNNEFQILISTTVIEVGIDNKNATVMLIFNAERFGLSQLHQLRGRVGRGDKESFCFLISNKDDEKRLKVIESTTDGFKLSEEDLKLRGPGDFFGYKQSGMPSFKYANLINDFNLLETAKNDAEYLINSQKIAQNKELLEKIEKEIHSISD